MLDDSPSPSKCAKTEGSAQRPGPLSGYRVLEVESIGPGPFAAMILADLGANVLKIERPSTQARVENPVLGRGRAGTLTLDLKAPADRARFLQLVERADALIEGFRPGVMERLSLGPDICHAHNARLVYGRMTGWGRSGPLAHSAGHDINYIALTGSLHACGTAASGPIPPLNLIGDFAGGGLPLALGIVSALLERCVSGQGQVVDTAMIDGAGMLMAMIYGYRAMGRWTAPRAGNMFDGSAYYYRCYECADGRWVAVGAIEPQFRAVFFDKLGLAHEAAEILRSPDDDPQVHARIGALFREHDRDHWSRVFEGTDACVTPVLAVDEVLAHPHNREWGSFLAPQGFTEPRGAPRFSRTPGQERGTVRDTRADLAAWGIVPA